MPKLRRRIRILVIGGSILLLAGFASAWWLARDEPDDTRFNGAYRLGDDVLIVVPRVGETLRYRIAGTGESRVLHPAGGLRYETRRPDDGGEATAEVVVTFDRPTGATGPAGLRFARIGEAPEWAERIALRETEGTFVSDELTLRSRVVLPPVGVGEAPFPAVVLVHGSGDESAIDRYAEPYLFASHGIASLVYDKRGTGGSEGEYTQNFHVLARDVVAAVEMLGARPEIDRHRIHLAGFSQGGWIAPLAASHVQDGGGPPIRSLLIAFGPMVPVTEEDRWGWIYALRREGFGEEAIAEAQQLHELVMAIVDRGEDRWGQAKAALDAARGKPWYEALAGSDSTLGFLAETSIPFWLMKPYARWRSRPVAGEPFIDRLYDPAPVVTDLTVPSLWLLAGEDSSMPTAWTIEKLEAARAAGAPVSHRLWPEAEHGIWRFEEREDGRRRLLGYEPEYMMTMVSWLRERSGLATSPPP